MNMKADSKLFCMMSRGYSLELEYLGHEVGFLYTVLHRGHKVSQFYSLDAEDIDAVEGAYLKHHRDTQLKSILDDVKLNYFIV